ncbi:alpha/beta fold hydrolase [Nocardioides nitrophenolicus]|uniref:alpha/beta fold hydrolase n=1 Tax=Nocardioides nitrophenolicus TaxID=60489 RepID=UPI00195C5A9E|nr:alpha/beta fold hydrolase [Nocardioides nitrophenolicus]MBM7517953.1 alpha-beta hydrolase superfamily lysophospholipase [Nocardioides nitrophenolicus]
MPTTASFTSPTDGTAIATCGWGEEIASPRGVVQIAHGIAEHGRRYDRLARALVAAGYVVHAVDHRGHGDSVASPDELGHFDFTALVADVADYGAALRAEHPDLPLFLVAHSMGSFAAQTVILDHSAQYAGVVLSGSTALDVLAAELAQAEGPVGLEAFNAGFEHRTGYEWLSRDEAEVDAYVADPRSGFDLPDDAVPQLFAGAARLADPTALAGIRSDLPLLVVSGDGDPVSGAGQLVQLLGQRYRDAGLTDVTVTLYPEARHEIFNETNRDQITADLVAWLHARSA